MRHEHLGCVALVGLAALGCRPAGGVSSPLPDLDGTVFIRGGSFRDVGGQEHVIEDLFMDRTEVTVSAYRACVRAGACSGDVPPWLVSETPWREKKLCNYHKVGRAKHPMGCVALGQAMQYCAWKGKRLPTEWEWEWAARGRDEGRRFPWGDELPTCDRVVMSRPNEPNVYACGEGYTTWPVGSKPAGASRDGVLDLVGNVSEFVLGEEPGTAAARGEAFIGDLPVVFEVWRRRPPRPFEPVFPYGTGGGPELGFRCVVDADVVLRPSGEIPEPG